MFSFNIWGTVSDEGKRRKNRARKRERGERTGIRKGEGDNAERRAAMRLKSRFMHGRNERTKERTNEEIGTGGGSRTLTVASASIHSRPLEMRCISMSYFFSKCVKVA